MDMLEKMHDDKMKVVKSLVGVLILLATNKVTLVVSYGVSLCLN